MLEIFFYGYIIISMLLTYFIFFYKLEEGKVFADLLLEDITKENQMNNPRFIVGLISSLLIILWPLFIPIFIVKLIKGKNLVN